MDFTPLQCNLCAPPPPRQPVFARARNQHIIKTVIIKQGNEQRDYETVNYSVTLKLRACEVNKAFRSPFLQRQHIITRLFLAFLMYSSPDRREKNLQSSTGLY